MTPMATGKELLDSRIRMFRGDDPVPEDGYKYGSEDRERLNALFEQGDD